MERAEVGARRGLNISLNNWIIKNTNRNESIRQKKSKDFTTSSCKYKEHFCKSIKKKQCEGERPVG
jgi:hypothetical protein